MKYECPSCKMGSEDTLSPLDQMSTPLCVFCSTKHSQKELLNWQMDHLKDITPSHFPQIIRHMYRFLEQEIQSMHILINDYRKISDS